MLLGMDLPKLKEGESVAVRPSGVDEMFESLFQQLPDPELDVGPLIGPEEKGCGKQRKIVGRCL